MEAYTSMKLNVKGNTNMNEIADLFKKTLLSKVDDDFSKKYVPVFCDDMEIKDNKIIVDDSCSLSSSEMDYFKDTITTIATVIDCDFTFEAHNEYCSCGYEEFDEAIYKDGILTFKRIGGDCMFGACGECGEDIVSAFDYDPNTTYTCPECGRVVPEEEKEFCKHLECKRCIKENIYVAGKPFGLVYPVDRMDRGWGSISMVNYMDNPDFEGSFIIFGLTNSGKLTSLTSEEIAFLKECFFFDKRENGRGKYVLRHVGI